MKYQTLHALRIRYYEARRLQQWARAKYLRDYIAEIYPIMHEVEL